MTKKTDELRERVDQSPVRAISLHYWLEELKLARCKDLVASTISLTELWPVKAFMFKDVFARPTSKKWRAIDDIELAELQSTGQIIIESGKPFSKANLKAHSGLISVSVNDGSYSGEIYFQHAPDVLTIKLGLKIISAWLAVVTPQYGFSSIDTSEYAMRLHSGQPSSIDDEVYWKRIRAHEAVRHCEPHEDGYLGKRLLDVFELNILSSAHLRSGVFNMSLEDWIASGNRGTLIRMKQDVYAWVVPGEVRADIRQSMLRGGYLIVPE